MPAWCRWIRPTRLHGGCGSADDWLGGGCPADSCPVAGGSSGECGGASRAVILLRVRAAAKRVPEKCQKNGPGHRKQKIIVVADDANVLSLGGRSRPGGDRLAGLPPLAVAFDA